MRDLIRPALFVVARLALSVAVFAWVVSRWWNVELKLMTGPDSIAGTMGIVSEGWSCYGPFSIYPAFFAFDAGPNERPRLLLSQAFSPPIFPHLVDRWFSVGGLTIWQGAVKAFGLRHELTITVTALFNGVLMWVYRKQRKELAANE